MNGEISLSRLVEETPMMGVDLEGVDEETFSVEVFPNRPDLLNIEGFARALNGFLDFDKGLTDYTAGESGFRLIVDSKVEKVRPYISTAIVKEIDLTDEAVKSLMNVQEKLHVTHGRNRVKVAIGVHDLDKIKPDFTYTTCNPDESAFTPLEMNTEMTPRKILSKHPKGREYAFTLEDFRRYPIIYDARGEVLSLPPIINGEYSRLSPDTRSLFIECTGLSQKSCDEAVNIIATALADRGGRIESLEIKYK